MAADEQGPTSDTDIETGISYLPVEWRSEVAALAAALRDRFPRTRVVQLKEKWWTLRAYHISHPDDHAGVEGLISVCRRRLAERGVHPLRPITTKLYERRSRR